MNTGQNCLNCQCLWAAGWQHCSAPGINYSLHSWSTSLGGAIHIEFDVHGTRAPNPPTSLCDGGPPSYPFWVRTSLVAQMVKNLPALQETWVQSLSQEDTLEKGMATHSRILARRISWTEELGRLHSMGSQRVRHDVTNTFTFTGQKWIWVFVVLSCSPRFQ